MAKSGNIFIRPAVTGDVPEIAGLIEPLVRNRVLLGKEKVGLYEGIQEFMIAELDGRLIGCGALHVFWEDLGEVRTLAVAEAQQHKGIGSMLLREIETRALRLGLQKLFCLTFEVNFFESHGYLAVDDDLVDPEVYLELLLSPDEGMAEFLDLARVKPNTLGNARMLKTLSH